MSTRREDRRGLSGVSPTGARAAGGRPGGDVLDQIFDFLVRDFSKFALQLYSKTSSTWLQRVCCRRMIRKPVVDPARFARVWEKHVGALRGAYRMNA